MIQLSTSGAKLIEQFEKYVEKAYIDEAGYLTYGYGSRFKADGSPVLHGDSISQPDAQLLLISNANRFGAEVSKFIKVTLNQNRQDSLLSLIYNIGPENFEVSTLLRTLNANQEDPAITHWFLVWDKDHQGGILVESAGLLARRTQEAKLWWKPVA